MRAPRQRLWSSITELRRLVDEVADTGRDPIWWGVAIGGALLETLAAPPGERTLYTEWLSANGGPRSDTFLARDRSPITIGSAAERIAQAILLARAAAAAIEADADLLPDQPLLRCLAWQNGWLVRREITRASRVVFIIDNRPFLVDVNVDVDVDVDAAPLLSLAESLGAVLAGRIGLTPIARTSRDPVPAAIAISLDEQPILHARHLHRHAWTAGGGPWLGLGFTSSLELVTTCHLAVDGYGHGRLSHRIFSAVSSTPPAVREALVHAAARGLGTALPDVARAPILADAAPLGFAGRVLGPDVARLPFSAAAYAFGRALERSIRAGLPTAARNVAGHSPTFQIPIAPGDFDDPERRRRRVVFGLSSVHMQHGAFEPYDRFRARMRSQLEREARSAGIVTRFLSASTRLPIPPALKRRLLASNGNPSRWLPQLDALSGRGCLSSIRLDDDDLPPPPLYACSSPGVEATARDPRGAVTLTLVYHPDSVTASLCGTGLASTESGANAFLDRWLSELATCT